MDGFGIKKSQSFICRNDASDSGLIGLRKHSTGSKPALLELRRFEP